MNPPFFSIVIPTRNRGAELFHTLRTCIGQDFNALGDDSYEIVVSDNCSTDDIPGVVRAIASPKVRYVRTSSYLSMTDSWEFAVSQARGRYVGIVGTDDGYMLDTLTRVHAIIEESRADAVTFQGAYYYWPSCPNPGLRNKLLIPAFIFQAGLHHSHQLIGDALKTLYYGRLPCFLNSFCSSRLLQDIRLKHGRIFDSVCPDVYSGFFTASAVNQIYVCNRAMLVGGVSAGSAGGNAYFEPQGGGIREHLSKYEGIRSRQRLVDYPFAITFVLESATLALQRGNLEHLLRHMDVAKYLAHCHQQAVSLRDADQRRMALAAISHYVDEHPHSGTSLTRLRINSLRRKLQTKIPASIVRATQKLIYDSRRSTGVLANKMVDAHAHGITNVYDAARYLTGHMNAQPE